jgi:hypothetical protein
LRHSAIVNELPPLLGTQKPAQFFASGADVSMLRYRNNSTELRVRGSEWNLVVTSDVAWPGWVAEWNRRRLPVVKVNGAFVGVFVPPGDGVLRLRYEPSGLLAGSTASLLSLVAIGIGVIRFGGR